MIEFSYRVMSSKISYHRIQGLKLGLFHLPVFSSSSISGFVIQVIAHEVNWSLTAKDVGFGLVYHRRVVASISGIGAIAGPSPPIGLWNLLLQIWGRREIGRMLESELCASRIMSPFREESGDEELSVLPRHTKVIVTGNNRTKSVLVGLQGVVKKAVGLGGWHWLVLKNGVEVKLQRNALSVLEPPTGNEEDDEHYFDNSSSSSDMGEKDHDFTSSVEFHKLSKPRVRPSKPWAPSASAKSNNRSCFKDLHCNVHFPQTKVNMAKLGSNSLWRYCRRFHLASVNPGPSKEHMVNTVQRHFASQRVDEVQAVVDFIRAAKRLKKVNRNRE
ncbi:hypothetical protein Nepgr_011225 [Nepenthes gracilis]|uniref:Histone deacetylase complex subunit SAP30 Sin3 binding domain-containing protein n=1 Tax=Nepenthes gracilis TaxID=150966 RepID=A0AAD3SEJ2_NEPGR|nr:hypothetical protein Nepgr_011225 [Nepenthes gracilis]